MQQQSSDNKTDAVFRRKLGNLQPETRSRVWMGIAASLDKQYAERKKKIRRAIYLISSVIVLVSLLLTAILDPVATRKKITDTEGQITHMQPGAEIFSPQNKSTKNENSINLVNNNREKTVTSSTSSEIYESVFPFIDSENEIIIPDEAKGIENRLFEIYLMPDLALAKPKIEQELFLLPATFNNLNLSENGFNDQCNREVYIKAAVGLNRCTIADQWMAGNENFVDKLKLQPAYMVAAGFKIAKSLSAELAWNILSNEGIAFSYSPPVRNSSKNTIRQDCEIKLQYTQVPVKLRYNIDSWSGLLKTHVTYSIAAGIMYGKLLKAGYTIADYKLDPYIKHHEIAGIADAGIDIKLSKHLAVSTGFGVSLSNNILVKDKFLNPFTEPHSFIAGGNLGIKYFIGGCK